VSNPALKVRKHLELAAYCGFTPVQYKFGHAFEFAQPPFPFPLDHAVLQPREPAGRDRGGHGAPQAVPQQIGDMEISVIHGPSM